MNKNPNDVIGLNGSTLESVRSNQMITDFRCEQCGKYFAAARSLALHEKIHIGNKPFKCPVDGCGKEFYVHAMLVRHAHVHSQVREEECTFKNCTSHIKKFKTKAAVRQHIKNWHSIEKYEQRENKLIKKLEKYRLLLQNYKKLKIDYKHLYEENRLLRHNQELSVLDSDMSTINNMAPGMVNHTSNNRNNILTSSNNGNVGNNNENNESNMMLPNSVLSINHDYHNPVSMADLYTNSNMYLTFNNMSLTHKKHVQKPPDYPKKPVPPYSKYVTERYKSIKQSNPELTFIECSKKIAYEWKELQDIVKEEYNTRYKQEMEEYHKEVEAYKLKHINTNITEESNGSLDNKIQYSSTINTLVNPVHSQEKYMLVCQVCGNNNFSKILRVNQSTPKSQSYSYTHDNVPMSNSLVNIMPSNNISNSLSQSMVMTQPSFPTIALNNDINLHNTINSQNIDSLLQLSHSMVNSVTGVVLPSHPEK